MPDNKTYLGDSVYAQDDGYYIILTTENGLIGDPSNTILLEPCVYDALTEFVARREEEEEQCKSTDA